MLEISYAPIKGTFNLTYLFRRYCVVLLVVTLCSCTPKNRPTICGMPVHGTPWQLAASIHDNGDGTFVPQCVDLVTTTKAYISGYLLRDTTGALLPDELPATLICDLSEKGEVCGVMLHCENLDNK